MEKSREGEKREKGFGLWKMIVRCLNRCSDVIVGSLFGIICGMGIGVASGTLFHALGNEHDQIIYFGALGGARAWWSFGLEAYFRRR